MSPVQMQELLELQRRIAGALEELLRLHRRAPRERKLHPKSHAARVLGINKGKLARYIAAGVVRTTLSGKLERVPEEELQRHLQLGLPELADVEGSRPRRRAYSPRPPTARPPSEKPGDAIRALSIP